MQLRDRGMVYQASMQLRLTALLIIYFAHHEKDVFSRDIHTVDIYPRALLPGVSHF